MLNDIHGNKHLLAIVPTAIIKTQDRVRDNLLPFSPRLREKTRTSAPSLTILVLKPFPSERQ